MYRVKIEGIDLAQIAYSGQCFRWNMIEDDLCQIVAFDRCLYARQLVNEIELSCDKQEWQDIWSAYFDVDTDYARIGRLILDSDDEYLKNAYANGRGIRILRQDLWETIVSFIISQNNNIKRIRGSIETICERCGLEVINAGEVKPGTPVYRFPKAGEIDPDFFIDKSLGLGYRDVYLHDIYEFAQNNPGWLNSLRELSYEAAMKEFKAIKGIGPKVANCICLFGLHHVDAFPIDTHVKQILALHYADGFDFERYKGVAGIVQQYMFFDRIS